MTYDDIITYPTHKQPSSGSQSFTKSCRIALQVWSIVALALATKARQGLDCATCMSGMRNKIVFLEDTEGCTSGLPGRCRGSGTRSETPTHLQAPLQRGYRKGLAAGLHSVPVPKRYTPPTPASSGQVQRNPGAPLAPSLKNGRMGPFGSLGWSRPYSLTGTSLFPKSLTLPLSLQSGRAEHRSPSGVPASLWRFQLHLAVYPQGGWALKTGCPWGP